MAIKGNSICSIRVFHSRSHNYVQEVHPFIVVEKNLNSGLVNYPRFLQVHYAFSFCRSIKKNPSKEIITTWKAICKLVDQLNWFWYRRTVRKIFLSNESPCLLGRERPFLDDWFCLYYDPDRPACWNRTFKKHGVAMCIYLLSQWTFPKHKRGAISYPLETIFVENNRKTAEDMGI